MNKETEFYTLKGYQLLGEDRLTTAMEDYLEMICRISAKGLPVRSRDLADRLHVKPSSVSKMVQQLASQGYLYAEKYGVISVTAKGKAAGNYLLYRHKVIYEFLCVLNQSPNQLEETEKIEHFLSRTTVDHLDRLTKSLNEGHGSAPDGLK